MNWEFDEKGVLREHEQGRTGSGLGAMSVANDQPDRFR